MKLQNHFIKVTNSWLGITVKFLMVALMLLSVAVAQAQNKVVVIPLLGDDEPTPIKYKIGDTGPAGGIVFHVTNEGLNGLEAAPVDQARTSWGCFGKNVEGVIDINVPRETVKDTLDPNSGAVNTPLIAVQCAERYVTAAVYASVYVWPKGQTDGFLPNKEELNLLYAQRNIVEDFFPDFPSFSASFYFSSTERDNQDAWVQSFKDGVQIEEKKSNVYNVRAIRSF